MLTIDSRRELYRIIDQNASAEAASALRASAARSGDPVLTFASAIDEHALDRLRDLVTAPEFLAIVPRWTQELREVAALSPDSGACTVASALKLWLWTARFFRVNEAVLDELALAIVPLLAARAFSIDVAIEPSVELRRDLAQVYAAHVSALAAATCAELVFGYRRHLVWDAEGCSTCYNSDDLDELEAIMPGFASGAGNTVDVIEADGSHPAKRGPCASLKGLDVFLRLRNRLDACLTGARIAKDRAAAAIGRG